MKKLLLCFCISASAGALHAQIPSVQPQLPKQSFGFKSKIVPKPLFADTSILLSNGNGLKLNQPNSSIDNMPVAGLGPVVLTLQGNSGQGFNVYSATPDNMPVLKPDSTVYFAMPNAFNTPAWPAERH